MENSKDKQYLINQLNQLRVINDKSKEYLSAVELLMVDNNNGRLKDEGLQNEMERITSNINEVAKGISALQHVLDNYK